MDLSTVTAAGAFGAGGILFLCLIFAILVWWSLNMGPGKHAGKKIPPPGE